MPCSTRARSMPTWTAPRFPPPPSTKATGDRPPTNTLEQPWHRASSVPRYRSRSWEALTVVFADIQDRVKSDQVETAIIVLLVVCAVAAVVVLRTVQKVGRGCSSSACSWSWASASGCSARTCATARGSARAASSPRTSTCPRPPASPAPTIWTSLGCTGDRAHPGGEGLGMRAVGAVLGALDDGRPVGVADEARELIGAAAVVLLRRRPAGGPDGALEPVEIERAGRRCATNGARRPAPGPRLGERPAQQGSSPPTGRRRA